MAEAQSGTSGVEPPTGEEKRDEKQGLVKSLRSFDGRAIFFVVACLLMLGLAFSGVVTVGSGVEVSREESIEIARDHVDFEPVNAEARLFRQGFRLSPVWGVSFSIPDPDDSNDFERLSTVEIDARTGEVLVISIDNGGDE